MTSEEVKSLVLEMGADLCGIAPVERFAGAPEGFHPRDIWPGCRSVLVFACRLPEGALDATSCIPYTFACNRLNADVDSLTLALARRLEDRGLKSVPLPSDDPSEHWEAQREHARGVLSLRHAGWLAGMGSLGRNNLLVNDRLGNMLHLGAVLLDADLEGDPPANYGACPDGCSLCIESCPRSALDGVTVDQKACRPLSNCRNERGFILKKCWTCRKVCPNRSGIAGAKAAEPC